MSELDDYHKRFNEQICAQEPFKSSGRHWFEAPKNPLGVIGVAMDDSQGLTPNEWTKVLGLLKKIEPHIQDTIATPLYLDSQGNHLPLREN
ncbi:MAG: hypothetical protein AABX11_03295 [Nanoarchaeota archaeon]